MRPGDFGTTLLLPDGTVVVASCVSDHTVMCVDDGDADDAHAKMDRWWRWRLDRWGGGSFVDVHDDGQAAHVRKDHRWLITHVGISDPTARLTIKKYKDVSGRTFTGPWCVTGQQLVAPIDLRELALFSITYALGDDGKRCVYTLRGIVVNYNA